MLLGTSAVRGDDVEAMKDTLATMEQTIADLKTRIAVLEKERDTAAKPSPDASRDHEPESMVEAEPKHSKRQAQPHARHSEPAANPEPTTSAEDIRVATAPKPGAAGKQSQVRDFDGFQDLQQAAPRPENRPLDPELKGFVFIPGTQTMFKIGGSARLDAIQDFGNNGNPNQFVPSTIPVDGQPGDSGDSRSTIHGKGTRLSLELRRPAEQLGKLRIYNEYDFFGDSSSNTMTFRLRHFYGQAWNFLIGQTFSGFMDPDIWPDVLDYQGPVGLANRRQAQVRYTQPLWDNCGEGHAYVSVEYAQSDLLTETLPVDSHERSVMPDVVLGGRWEGDLGHIQLAAIGRSLGFESDSGVDENVLGWGVSLSGGWEITKCDEIMAQLTYGEGISRYVNDFSGTDLDAAWIGGDLDTIPIFAPTIGYTHRWSDHFRSTVTASCVFADLPGAVDPFTPETTASLGANLVWQPTPAFRMGLEYLYGTKETADGSDGDAQRLDFVIRYDLVK